MEQNIIHISLLVRDYDEALAFYTQKLNFNLLEDLKMSDDGKRWIRVAPPGSKGPALVLAKAKNVQELAALGNQTGGRVFLFLQTDDFWRDYEAMKSKNVRFVREAKEEPHGTVAIFADLYGNLWDLIQPKIS